MHAVKRPRCQRACSPQLNLMVGIAMGNRVHRHITTRVSCGSLVLHGNCDRSSRDSSFGSNSSFCLLFRSPIGNGLTMCLTSARGTCYLLPCQGRRRKTVPVLGGERCVFFSVRRSSSGVHHIISRCGLAYNIRVRLGEVCVMFSPGRFIGTISKSNSNILPHGLSFGSFRG